MPKKNGKDLYIISEGGSGHVKIGSANNVDKRLNELQTGNSRNLHVLAKFPDLGHKERFSHEYLKSNRYHHEWFKFGRPVINLIKLLLGKSKNAFVEQPIKDFIDRDDKFEDEQ